MTTDNRHSGETARLRNAALARLGFRPFSGQIAVVQQLTPAECGAACLAMTLGYFGRALRLDELRDQVGSDRDGTNAASIVHAATAQGLRGRGVRIEVEDLEYLPPASILHWEFNHFVVFERLRRNAIDIIDPALGRRRVPIEQARRSFTGVALIFEPAETFEPAPRDRRSLWRYVRQALGDRRSWAPIFVTAAMLQIFVLAIPALTGIVVDRVVPRQDYHLLAVLSAGLAALVGFQFVANMVRGQLLLQLRTVVDARMTLAFVEHLVSLPYLFFQRRSAGDLMLRLNSNAIVREIVTSGALSALLDGSLVVIYLVILFIASVPMATLAAVLGLLQISLFWVTRRRQRELLAENLQKQAREQSCEFELLAGIETLKTMGGEARAVERWSDLFVDVLNVSLARGRLEAAIEAIMSALRLASPLVLLGFGALQVLDGRLTLGQMLAVSALAGAFLGPLSTLVVAATGFQLLGSYVERINDVFDATPEQDRTAVAPAPRLSGRIAFDGVSFRYGSHAPHAVTDVSFEIQPDAHVAIVGRTGAGKSTLAGLLVGLYRPERGRVTYDGIDLAELELTSLRNQIGVVTQRPYLFGGTIRSNLALTRPEASLEEIMEAARLAQIHDEIAAMPMGYDTYLADGGASLSGGQRQRLALARALVRRPRVLVLDEATSSLDADTESRVQRALASLRGTRIVVAHRLSTVVPADWILVMDQGCLVERGTHAELLARHGVYAGLVAAQMEPAAR